MSIYRHMDCPICSSKLKTVNSRKTAGGSSTWRRKHCPKCYLTLTSRENLDLSQILKIDGSPYSRAKLISKLARLSSRSSEEDISDTVSTIESRLLKLFRHHHKITPDIFSSEVTRVLEKLDKPASLRYKAELEEA